MAFLERDASLAELDALLQAARDGEGRVALVNGEAGIGKTTLVEQFTRKQQRDVRVLWGVCDAVFMPRPFGPLHDMAAQMRANVSALLHSGSDLSALFAAVLSELQSQPVIAVFEDVHWADEATLDLLRFLGRRIARTRALLVLTYRDDELGGRHPLRSILGDLVTSTATRRIPLLPLSVHAVHMLVGNHGIDAAALYRQTGGNPFFVTEVLANVDGLPATIRDAVLARVARLSPSAQAVLQAAAVVGPRIDPWVLAELIGAEARFAEECLAYGILVAQDATLAFRHELARQAVLESISPPHKTALHGMALDAIKRSPASSNDLASLAHHAEVAHNRDAVLEYAPAAAQRAAVAGAHREAAVLYALALRFAADLPPDEHAQLLQSCAQQYHAIDQRSSAVHMLREALQLWRKAGNPIQEGGTLANMATMLMGLGQDIEAEQCAQAATEILEAHPPGSELALAYRVRAEINGINHNLDTAIDWAEKSIALGAYVANKAEYFIVQNILGSAWMSLDYERGCRYLEQSRAAAHEHGQKAAVVHAFAQSGSIASELHHFRQAERWLSDGLVYAAEYDLDRLRFYILAWQAWTHLHLGAWNEAARVAAMVPHDASMSAVSRLMVLLALGRLYVRRGDPQARPLLDQALVLAKDMHNIDRLGPLHTVRAEAAWLSGDFGQASAEACAAYNLAVSTHHPWYTGELAFWRWRAGDAVQAPEWAAKAFTSHVAGDWRAAADEWAQLGCPYEQARALADGDTAAQMAALTIFEQLGARPAAATLRRKLRAEGVRHIPRGPRPTTRERPFGLTTREMDILCLLAEGLGNAQIAARLCISPKTVDHHVSAVLSKLGVHSRATVVALAQQYHLLPDQHEHSG